MARRDRQLSDYKLKGHPIRWYDPNGRFAIPRVLLAGDSAGVDPLFGEGISLALGYGDVAAETLINAFARNDFSFSDYKANMQDHWLLWQLPCRTRLARLAYLLQYPWLVRFGWRLAKIIIRFTRWRNPDFVPAEQPRMVAGTS